MNEQEAIEILQNLNVKLTEMAGNKVNGIDEIFGWNEITGICEAIKALEEIQQYRAIGTVEEIKQLKENGAFTGIELAQIAAMQMTLKKYREIGTPEECRAAVEKMKAKKTKTKVNEEDVRIGCVVFAKGTKVHYCPECNRPVTGADVYCRNCGQALIW